MFCEEADGPVLHVGHGDAPGGRAQRWVVGVQWTVRAPHVWLRTPMVTRAVQGLEGVARTVQGPLSGNNRDNSRSGNRQRYKSEEMLEEILEQHYKSTFKVNFRLIWNTFVQTVKFSRKIIPQQSSVLDVKNAHFDKFIRNLSQCNIPK